MMEDFLERAEECDSLEYKLCANEKGDIELLPADADSVKCESDSDGNRAGADEESNITWLDVNASEAESNGCSKDESFPLLVCDQAINCTENLQLPQSNPINISGEQLKYMWQTPAPELTCLHQLRENQVRIHRFITDTLGYDTFDQKKTEVLPRDITAKNGAMGSLKCTQCERQFFHRKRFYRHMAKHAIENASASNTVNKGGDSDIVCVSNKPNDREYHEVIECMLCGRIFPEPQAALRHLQLAHFNSILQQEKEVDILDENPCELYVDHAERVLLREERLVRTKNKVDDEICFLKVVILNSLLQCEWCEFLFADISKLFAHTTCHVPERIFECFSCGIFTRTLKEINQHFQFECIFLSQSKIVEYKMLRFFVCNVCENKFASLDMLYEHRSIKLHFLPRMSKLSGKLLLPCERCTQSFKCSKDYISHLQEKHSRKNKFSKTEGTCLSSQEKKLSCGTCGKSFVSLVRLKKHEQAHQSKAFNCTIAECSLSFTNRTDLNNHIRECHKSEWHSRFQCTVCKKIFQTRMSLHQHRIIHRDERKFECETCHKRFYRFDALKTHNRIHTGEKPFGCRFCTKYFRQRGDCEKHMRSRHGYLNEKSRRLKGKLDLDATTAATSTTVVKAEPEAVAAVTGLQ